MKRILIVLIATMCMLTACGGSGDTKKTEAATEAVTEAVTEAATTEEETTEEETTEASALAEYNIIYQDYVRNDKTGRWRLAKMAESVPTVDIALDYYKEYFESDDELHFVINFTLNTTTSIARYDNYLDVCVREYVSKEEHDAVMLGSGMLLKEYWVYVDTGEVEELDLDE